MQKKDAEKKYTAYTNRKYSETFFVSFFKITELMILRFCELDISLPNQKITF